MDQGLIKISPLEFPSFLEYSDFNRTAVIILSPDYRFVNFNESAKEIYPWKISDILNKSYFDWFKEKGITEPISIADLESAKNGKPKYNIENPSASGKKFFLWNVIANIDKNGVCSDFILSAIDVTTQKNLEREMAKQKSGNKAIYAMSKEVMGYNIGEERTTLEYVSSIYSYLEKIISHMPCYVYWKNGEFVYLGCNDLTAELLKFPSRRAIIGKTDYDFGWDVEKVNEYRKVDEFIIKTGRSQLNFEETITKSDGRTAVLLVNKMPIFDEQGKPIGIVGISIDITERKQSEIEILKAKELAEAANKAKTEFLENMRHDIRTPLSGIVGLAELLNNEDLDKAKIKEFATHLDKASKELLRFLNEVLESINVASGKIPLLQERFSLREILDKVVKLHQPVALKKQLKLTLCVDEAIPEYLIGDSVRIYRVVLELLANALKFTRSGHINIFAKFGKREDQKVVVKIFVEDTGIGIPAEKQQDLFVNFKRLTPSYEGIYEGAGLGLSIVKQFLEDIKGEIYVDSQSNMGTKFVCIIPLKEPLLEEAPFQGSIMSVNTKTSIQVKDWKQNEKNIRRYGLLVEDHPIAALAAKSLLLAQGCDVDIAEDGKTAIKLAQLHQYDFILMDIGLPDIDGYEVTKNIRLFELNSKHRNFIIGLTGHVDAGKKQLGLGSGMNVILTKPLTQEMSVNLLSNFIPNNPASERAANNMASNQDEAGVNPTSSTKILNEQGIIVENILQMFIKGLPDEELKLEHAYSIQDWKTIEDIVHKLRGGCGYCGSATTEFKEICDQLIEEIQALKEINK